MNEGPANSTTSKETGLRFYTWDDVIYPSVTSILGMAFAKPGLNLWYAKMAVDAVFEGQPEPERAAERYRDFAADRGSRIHNACEQVILTKEPPYGLEPEDLPYFTAFLQWERDFEPWYWAAESTVYNRSLLYAGTADIIAMVPSLGDELGVVDVKTSKSIHKEYALQLAAYQYAEVLRLPTDAAEKLPTLARSAVLHLRPNGKYSFRIVDDPENAFRSFRACLDMLESHKKVGFTTLKPPTDE